MRELKLTSSSHDQSLPTFFEAELGITVQDISPTTAGFTSRCWRVVGTDEQGQQVSLHVKFMPNERKSLKSQYEPMASALLARHGIPTPRVIAYIPAGYVTDGQGSHACVISEYIEPREGSSPIQMQEIVADLTSDQKLLTSDSLARILAGIHSIPQEEGIQIGLIRETDTFKSKEIVQQAHDKGFLTAHELQYVLEQIEVFKDDPLSLVHKDLYTENLIVDRNNPIGIESVVDLEHAEFSGPGQDFYALCMFHFPRLNDARAERHFWKTYAIQRQKSMEYIRLQLQTFGLVRAAEVYLVGVAASNDTLKRFALEYKLKYAQLP